MITSTSSSAQPGPLSTHPTKPLAHTASHVSCFNAHKRFMGEAGSFGPFCNEDTGTAPVPTAAGGGAVLGALTPDPGAGRASAATKPPGAFIKCRTLQPGARASASTAEESAFDRQPEGSEGSSPATHQPPFRPVSAETRSCLGSSPDSGVSMHSGS